MYFDLKLPIRLVLICLLATVFALPQSMAQSHVVSSTDLQQEAVKSSQTRQQNIQEVQQFLSTPLAQKTLKNAKVDQQQIQTAVSQLNDAELAQMASRAHTANANFAAGNLTDRDLVIIILGLVALILIIVAVR